MVSRVVYGYWGRRAAGDKPAVGVLSLGLLIGRGVRREVRGQFDGRRILVSRPPES